ncbi:amidophosphoribosyltransferase [bacterium]|nr:amidophosphoribosyltransferase [bacterium]
MAFKDECGVFGVFGCKDAASLCYLGLYALQHRGEESAGIVSYDTKNFYVVKNDGHVSDVFNKENLRHLKGKLAIGHVRYSTTGSGDLNNIQPFYSKTSFGKIAIAHNGNITNALHLYKQLEAKGALFQSTVDSETIMHLVSRSTGKTVIERFQNTLSQCEGAYSLAIMGDDFLMAARDPHGFRPLIIGKLGTGYVISSETCALDLIGAEYIQEVNPGEIVFIDKHGLQSAKIPNKIKAPKFCIFEHIYFARPDSVVFGENVHQVRKELGAQLAREYHVDADLVMAIPDSGYSAALGYAHESGLPFEMGMTRNHYIGRTFIQPEQKIRDLNVKIKLNPIRSVLKGKRVVVIDDSIVRGTTAKRRVAAIRKAGAKEVHMRISAPPVTDPCHFGIDTPTKNKLIASKKSVQDICDYIGADSLGYLSHEGLLNVITAHQKTHYCTACFTGKYPIKIKNKGKHTVESHKKIKLHRRRST